MFFAYKNETFYLLVLKIFKFNKKSQNIPRHDNVVQTGEVVNLQKFDLFEQSGK